MQFALSRTGVDSTEVRILVTALREGRGADEVDNRAMVGRLVEELDELAWGIQDQVDAGTADEADYERAFSRARAASSLYFAADPSSLEAALEATYEASMTSDSVDEIRELLAGSLPGAS